MANKLLLTLVWVAVWLPGRAFPISRVGNASVADPLLGFSAELPAGLRFEREAPNDSVLLARLPGPFAGSLARPTPVYLAPVLNSYPALVGLNRDEALELLTETEPYASAWELTSTNFACGFVLRQRGNSSISRLALWGVGRGVFISSPPSSESADVQDRLVDAIDVADEACEWK